MGLFGMDSYMVQVEADLSQGLPRFDIVGLPDAAISEAKNRVRSAIKNTGFAFPVSRITVNLAPADTRKEGSVYDLPILMALLKAGRQINFDSDNMAFIGEVALDGLVRRVDGALPMVITATKNGIKTVFVPTENAAESSVVQGIEVIPVRSVEQLIKHLRSEDNSSREVRRFQRQLRPGRICAGLPRCQRSGGGKTCARDSRRRRSQYNHGRPARLGQKYARKAPAVYFAGHDL